MKAIVYTEYGPPEVLHLTEIPKPTPKDNEVLIRIHATSVGFGDLLARNIRELAPTKFNMPKILLLPTLMVFGFKKPKKRILGAELAGEVEAVGKNVQMFKVGDLVFAYRAQSFGGYAEYLCMPEDGCMAIKPANMTYEEAAIVPYGAIVALGLLKKANIQPGQKVLINGASGSIGSAAVQLAKSDYGAEVTGVCGTPRIEYVKSLGVDKVIDYTQEDFTARDETYDLIIDILGKSSFSRCKDSLTQNGRYLLASFKTKQLLQMLWTKMFGSKKVMCVMTSEKPEDLVVIKKLIEAGKMRSIVDRRYPLEQAAEAHRYVEEGKNKGPVAITVEHNGST